MAGVYRRCIPYFCFYVMICLVAGGNDDGRQEDESTSFEINHANTDVSVPEGIYTSTLENPSSEMVNSAALKKDSGFLMPTSLSMPSNSRPRTAIPDQGKKRHLSGLSGQDSENQRQSTHGAWEETSQRGNPEEAGQRHTTEDIQRGGNTEETGQRDTTGDIQQGGNPEETGQRHTTEDIQQGGNTEETGQRHTPEDKQGGNPEETGQRHTPEDIQQGGNPEETGHRHNIEDNERGGNPEETGQRHTPEDTQQQSTLTENEVSPNKTMQEIMDSLNAVNKTLLESDMLINDNGSPGVTTPQPTVGYTRQRKPPLRPIRPPHGSADMHAEKMESRANPCSRPMVLMCLLCLCGRLF